MFYFHITLTGIVVAAAASSFAGMVGAPVFRVCPVAGSRTGIAGAVALWLLSGPVVLMRFVLAGFSSGQRGSLASTGLLLGALLWAFCLGVVVLEFFFRLFLA